MGSSVPEVRHVHRSTRKPSTTKESSTESHQTQRDVARRIGSLRGGSRRYKKINGLPKKAKEKYLIIDLLRTKYAIIFLCKVLRCSKSGYYAWIHLGRPQFKHFDSTLAKTILKQYEDDTRQGIASLKMNLKAVKALVLTKKRIYRYMLLLNIQSITGRKKKKYGQIEHHTIPNLLKRDFTTTGPNQKWSIDVTYIHTVEGIEYLCAIKDMFDKSIIAFSQSRFNNNLLVLAAVNEALLKNPENQRVGLILHSDQGFQFTSKDYTNELKRQNVRHSVSFQGSCVDNVPIESWFSLLKCECIYLHHKLTRNLAILLVSDYIDYYNNHRRQEKLKELAPIEFRRLALV